MQLPRSGDDNHPKSATDELLVGGKLAAQQLLAIMEAFEKRDIQI